jgi:hypothetical protein
MKKRIQANWITHFLLILIVSLAFTSCKKNEQANPINTEQQLAENLKSGASYNDTKTPGVGNVFYEKKLVPDNPFQLLIKIVYNSDTIYYFGKTDASTKIEFIHTMVLARQNNTELLVTEIHPNTSLSRMYNIINGKKSRFVVETEHISKTNMVLSFLDHNWKPGSLKLSSG